MSHSIYIDSTVSDESRRARLYEGHYFVYSSNEAVRRFAKFAREMVEEAFAPFDPQIAQYGMPVEKFASLLGELKPRFIHCSESKQYVRAILEEMGCDPQLTYFDVPRLRSSTSDNFLTTGIAYAWHPHRDTWYSAPPCQINYWLPIYEIDSSNTMAFYPGYWNKPVENNSSIYNYYIWNQQHRGVAVTKHLKEDPRPLPRAIQPLVLDSQILLLCPVGGLIVFSGAQMHSSVVNTSGKTRYSIDFRTVHLDDVRGKRGAPYTDEQCTGTTMRDYMRCTDLTRLPDEMVALYDDGSVSGGKAIYQPTS